MLDPPVPGVGQRLQPSPTHQTLRRPGDGGFFQQLSLADVPGGVQGFITGEQEHHLCLGAGEGPLLSQLVQHPAVEAAEGLAGQGGLQGGEHRHTSDSSKRNCSDGNSIDRGGGGRVNGV
jgi:hypothetical protein